MEYIYVMTVVMVAKVLGHRHGLARHNVEVSTVLRPASLCRTFLLSSLPALRFLLLSVSRADGYRHRRNQGAPHYDWSVSQSSLEVVERLSFFLHSVSSG